eukprot:CAMPEP_0172169954 /NCGR_PEP_ID=MMETSP1050-20130122/10997_1 /TAXON_ID=233186 /ORGANISM="Cryptomonas curvata, Strain CCAP979/52" /LENGTH=108 /DNA_ID=CAMNT_0012841079 /DNA_START=92 /DNA_END=414 /DNA_ORIENTATION=+
MASQSASPASFTGSIERSKLNTFFDTYKLCPEDEPLFKLSCNQGLPTPARLTSTIHSGLDFISTNFRIRFNDLQPDRSAPRERFFFLAGGSNGTPLQVQQVSIIDDSA